MYECSKIKLSIFIGKTVSVEVIKFIITVFLISLAMFNGAVAATHQLEFTEQEKAYLETKKQLKLCIDPNWMPYEKISDRGQHFGITSDYFNIFQKRIGIPIFLYPTSTWNETLEAVRTRKCDLISAAKKTKQREVYLNFTPPYLNFPLAVAVKDTVTPNPDFTQEMHKTFALPKGYAAIENLPEAFPKVKILVVKNRKEGFEKVNKGEAYGYIDSWPIIAYALKTEGVTGLKIGGELPSYGGLGAATRNDEPELLSIFEKLTRSLSPDDQERINKKWLAVDVKTEIDYALLALILFAVLILIAVFSYLYWRLSKANKHAQIALEELIKAQIKLEELATTDKLTGLYNRAKIDEILQNEIYRSERYQHDFGVIMIDVDNFKQVNDTFGHHVGDDVLKEYAATLRDGIRKTDHVGRWGGDEFIVICPETDVDGVHAIAQKLCQKIATHDFETVGQGTASLGLAIPRGGDTITSLLKRADKALYQAKSDGRNRVQQADS